MAGTTQTEQTDRRGGVRARAGRPRGTSIRGETQRLMVYLDVDIAEEVRRLAKARRQSMTAFFEALVKKELECVDMNK